MKRTLKISALVLAFAGLTLGANAQTASKSNASNGVILSIGADAGIPTGDISNGYNFTIGGSIQADIPVAQQLFFTLNAGYNSVQGKDNAFGTGITATNIQLLPVKAGLKYFVANGFYIQGEAGAAFSLNKTDVGFDNGTAFIYAPQIGVRFPVGGKSYIDAGVRYQGSTDFSSGNSASQVNFVGLRLAYAFGTK